MDELEEMASSFDGDEDVDDEAGSQDIGDGTETDPADIEDVDFLDDDAPTRFGHLPRSTYADLSPPEQVSKWHESLLPIEADLITELDGANLFFVNVESMIIDLLLAKDVAFMEDTQFLRLVFTMEQQLSAMKACGGSFRLIFFDCMKKLFSSAFGESVWAFRQAFLCHCRSQGIDYAVFPHWYSKEFKMHVAEWKPSFFMVADNCILLEDEEEEEEAEEDEKPKLREILRALVLSCLSHKIHTVLLYGLQRRGNHMMAFSLEPDCYDAWVDHNIQADMLPLLSGEDEEEEEEEEEDVVPALQAFKTKASGKVDDRALLRSFFTGKFCRDTLEMCVGQNAVTCGLMKLLVKSLVLQEMMLRLIPLDKRAYSMPEISDWEFFEEKVSAGLERYFTMVGDTLAKLHKEELPEGVTFQTCDLFDGRLYRYIFQILITQGVKSKGKVTADFFKFQPHALDQLNFLWKESGDKDDFFPVDIEALLKMPDLEPPEMPAPDKGRSKPKLKETQNEFLQILWKEQEFTTIEEGEGEAPIKNCLWTLPDAENDRPRRWKDGAAVDSLKEEEHMEENEQEKKLRAKFAKKGKVTAADLAFQKKFQMKKKQLALRALAGYAKSLTGSDKLHPPIIMKEEAPKKDEKEKDKKEAAPAKISAKQQEILDKRKLEEQEKIKTHDAEQLKSWDKQVDALGEIQDPEKFEKDLLDLMLGFARITDSFTGFPAVTSAFRTSDAQAKLIVKVVKSCRTALKKMQLDRLPATQQPQVQRIIQYFFCMIQEAFHAYGTKDLDGKAVKLFQECLIAIGFPNCAKVMFQKWKDAQVAAAEKAAAAAAPADDKKGGKEDKKKGGKDDKKDAKADDKKGKKDDKKDKKDDKKDKKGKEKDEPEAGGEKDLDSYEVKKDVESLWSGAGKDEMAFQLLNLGPYMMRSVGNAKDPKGRVNFRPDKWQFDLLEIVDSERSALIVAPTASGKTFIGYYVMDQVLRADNEGVAVYVAPSKALVNQVSAEIYARFSSKTYPPHSKNELLGVFLREFNSAGGVMEQGKWKNCQVLVTIPHILEMLLVSPSTQDWVKRLKYVVFDEVHCIGEQEGGAQWEHTMQAIPCPFIALSATVADPSFFHGWLNGVAAKKKQAQVELVKHTERWNDLYKYIFTQGELKPLHPFCCLIEQSVRKNGLAEDLTLTPGEMCELYLQVSKVVGPKNKEWAELAPAKYFTAAGASYLTKADARKYESVLKELFLSSLRDGSITSEGFEQIVLGLQKPPTLEGSFAPPPRVQEEKEEESTDFRSMGKRNSYLTGPNTFKLCRSLDEKQYLPAIVFNFSRKELESMLKRLVKELKDQQWNKYYGDEEAAFRSKRIMEKRMAEYQAKMTAYEQAQKAKASKNQEANAARKEDDGEGRSRGGKESVDTSEDSHMLEPEPPVDIAEEIDMEFSFHSPKALGQWQEDIKETIADLKRRKIPQDLIDGLQRGIGMHHEGCKTRYKQAVEVLFRRKYLRVVFASETLALGINMPCRSTIFCGDSLNLNGLMFRQMAGRAGRRGFDLLGQVVFLDMSFLKVRRLIASDLSTLTGEFQLSPSTLLRILGCWEQTFLDIQQDRPLARSKEELACSFAPLFSMPFFKSEGVDLKLQVAYHTRFAVELLRKEGLIDESGFIKNLASLVAHLFEVEPANFILSRLLASGLLHKYLQEEEKQVNKGERHTHLTVKLTAILSWFMLRRRLPNNFAKSQPRKKHLPSKDCPSLPPLPPKILAELKSYNASVFELFQQLTWSVASKIGRFTKDDFTLPFSKSAFPDTWDANGPPCSPKDSEFLNTFAAPTVKFRARSPLAAISGAGDFFTSPNDLVTALRRVIQVDLNSLPIVPPAPGASDGLELTNSWALDFMMHGKTKYLYEDNGIDATKAYKLISTFKETIKMTCAAMAVYAPKDDIVLSTFKLLEEELGTRLGS